MDKDFQFTTKDDRTESENDFHSKRRAFIIYEDKVHFLEKGSTQSHYEFALSLGIDKDIFSTLCRGYYLDGELIFYKGNFTFDKELVEYAKTFIPSIKETLCLDNSVRIYFGLNIGGTGELWKPVYELID